MNDARNLTSEVGKEVILIGSVSAYCGEPVFANTDVAVLRDGVFLSDVKQLHDGWRSRVALPGDWRVALDCIQAWGVTDRIPTFLTNARKIEYPAT